MFVLLFSEKLIQVKEKARINFQRALKGKKVHVSAKSEFQVRDDRIKAAMEQMKSNAPWTVQKFLSEITDPTFDPLVAIIEQGMKKL